MRISHAACTATPRASRYRKPEVRLSSRGSLAGKDAGVDAESFHADWSEREIPLERDSLVLCARTAKGSDGRGLSRGLQSCTCLGLIAAVLKASLLPLTRPR